MNPNGGNLSYSIGVVNMADFRVVRHEIRVTTSFSQTDLGNDYNIRWCTVCFMQFLEYPMVLASQL